VSSRVRRFAVLADIKGKHVKITDRMQRCRGRKPRRFETYSSSVMKINIGA
jgi:hypothetical protein